MVKSTIALKTLRRATDQDIPFLRVLYASTRMEELSATDWSQEQKWQFLASQFQRQHDYYHEHFTHAEFLIIELEKKSIGRLYYAWEKHNLRVIDIALLPEYRQQGIARGLVNELLEQVRERNGTCQLYVELNNPALDWYLRLGFVPQTTNGVYQQLTWFSQSTVECENGI